MNHAPRSPSPPEAVADQDNGIDLQPTSPRFDARVDGRVDLAAQRPPARGPRQRRFEFDAKVIRDTLTHKFRSQGREDLALPIDNCHRTPTYKRCVGCAKTKVFYNRCERFYCPICAARLARDRRESVEWWSKVVHQPKHVILTVKSVPSLSKDYVRKLKADFRKLRAQKWAADGDQMWDFTAITRSTPTAEPMPGRKRRNGKLSVWTGEKMGRTTYPWRGGFWTIDVTFNRPAKAGEVVTRAGKTWVAQENLPGGWHVHFHAIVDCRYIDHARLCQEWAKLRGQDMSVCWVEDVRQKDFTAEACKYVCDGISLGNWPADKLVEFADALSEERCFDTFGCLYKQRAEWTKAREEILADRDVCECGCAQFRFFDESEWEWQQIKNDLAPPPCPSKPIALAVATLPGL